MPFPAMLAPDDPMRHAVNDNFVGGKNGGVEVDDVAFANRNFHSSMFPIAFNCFFVGNSVTRQRGG